MKMSELCKRPGGGVLKEIFKDAMQGQENDLMSAQLMVDILQGLTTQDELSEIASQEIAHNGIPKGRRRPPVLFPGTHAFGYI